MSRQKAVNPFYGVLVVAGIAFAITACAYGVMTLREIRGFAAASGESTLMGFLRDYGGMLMTAELFVLGIATVAAIGTDDFWERRANDEG